MPKFEVYAQVGNYVKGEIEADTRELATEKLNEKMNCFGFASHELLVAMCKNMKVEAYGWDMGLINVSEPLADEVSK